MAYLVIRTWRASESPSDGEYVHIEGRAAGVVSWLLTHLGIDNATRLRVTRDTIYFEQGSLAGFTQRVMPMSRMSSAYFGYLKPWKQALAVGLLLLPLWGLGLIVGPLIYILGKRTTIGLLESAGVDSHLEFRRSLIEGQSISEEDGRRVIGIIRGLMESSIRSGALATQGEAAQ